MTIPTTQNVVVDAKKAPVQPDSVVVTVDTGLIPAKTSSPKTVVVARQNNAGCLKIVLISLIIVGFVCASLGSYYIYKSFHSTDQKSYKGTCSLPVQSSPSTNMTLKEEVDITSDLETIKVPKFDNNDEATFIHDFKQEISVIRDDTDEVCYILPLNKQLIPPPQTFLDLLYGIRSGQYILDANRIRSNFEVVHPAIPSSSLYGLYGSYIADNCAEYQSYELNEIDTDKVTTTTMAPFTYRRRFVQYAGGEMLIQYYIFN